MKKKQEFELRIKAIQRETPGCTAGDSRYVSFLRRFIKSVIIKNPMRKTASSMLSFCMGVTLSYILSQNSYKITK